ncbi:hypothetical protein [Anabaena sp. PCC 7108]|uniref:hypothetical protein n=1 Tax=Anabaena sp. PCC 7108 TaxID=163908 RepID=UPI00034ACE84|nr:hypothetical protein [Anabaena sp. PCC 7108]
MQLKSRDAIERSLIATKYIKSTTKGNATAVIAVTASILEKEKAIVLSTGCDHFRYKPFAEHTIFDALAKHLGVSYIFAETRSLILDNSAENAFTSQNLTCMSSEWITQLYEAAIEANTNLVLQLDRRNSRNRTSPSTSFGENCASI